MLNYSTCKSLKEVGFPQSIENGEEVWMEDTACYVSVNAPEEIKKKHNKAIFKLQDLDWVIKIPTLEELIDEIGFYFVGMNPNPYVNKSKGSYMATAVRDERTFRGFGDTYKIAVAKLYIALSEKK